MILTVGPYSLTQHINIAKGLKEFSEEEYLSAELAGIKLVLENERLFNGINVHFAANPWDSTMIASTNGQIYKISLQFNSSNKILAKTVLQTTMAFVNREIGKYNEHPLFSNKYIWDTKEGNIILYKMKRLQIYSVNIFFTSNIIRSQMLKMTGAA
jgi:hypothetical protein